jgi:hypothetical protein
LLVDNYGNENVYNFDKAGFMMEMDKIITQLVVIGSERRDQPIAVQPGNRKWTTVIQGINAGGWTILMLIIIASKYYLSAWYEEDIWQDWAIAVSNNNWTTNKLRVKWLKHFTKHTEGKVGRIYWLHILDGYKNYQSPEF